MQENTIINQINKKSKDFIHDYKSNRNLNRNDQTDSYELHNLLSFHLAKNTYTLTELKNILSLNQSKSLIDSLELITQNNLRLINFIPYVRQNKILQWKKLVQKNGQDIFIAYFYKTLSTKNNFQKLKSFNWPLVISSDDTRLERILSNGVYDNHFHLDGAMAVGDINWCLVNNNRDLVYHLNKNENKFNKLFSSSYESFSISILKAVIIRRYLYFLIKELFDNYFYKKVYSFNFSRKKLLDYIFIKDINVLKYKYKKFDFDFLFYTSKKDYASGLCEEDEYWSGERALLYYFFFFYNQIEKADRELFNIYLIFRKEFFEEFVQNKNVPGFVNFMGYDQRKDFFCNGSLKSPSPIKSLWNNLDEKITGVEVRIAPSTTVQEFRNKIDNLVNNIKCVKYQDVLKILEYKKHRKNNFITNPQDNRNKNMYQDDFERDFGFVIHFIKGIDNHKINNKYKYLYPRNYEVRRKIEEQARALHNYFKSCERNKDYIVGIDAANIEIDCRPEVMAQVFRFLRNTIYKDLLSDQFKNIIRGVTYHVAEDFIDLADGLRAIWEAVEFLKLDNGDRLGHCIALGFDPELYYSKKGYLSYISKQTLLDNCVWLYYCLTDMNSSNPIKNILYSKAMELLEYIYKYEKKNPIGYSTDKENNNNYTIHDYYCSMFLRADNPKLCLKTEKEYTTGFRTYSMNDTENHTKALQNLNAQKIYKDYHYSTEVFKKGNEIVEFEINKEYILMIKDVQKYIKKILIDKKVIIEVNVTSNYLIGFSEKYSDSTLLYFNRHLLDNNFCDNVQVSICTDDQGIFLTNLISEFSIILEMLSNKESLNDSTNKYEIESVYEYINYLRKTSKVHSFLKYKKGNL